MTRNLEFQTTQDPNPDPDKLWAKETGQMLERISTPLERAREIANTTGIPLPYAAPLGLRQWAHSLIEEFKYAQTNPLTNVRYGDFPTLSNEEATDVTAGLGEFSQRIAESQTAALMREEIQDHGFIGRLNSAVPWAMMVQTGGPWDFKNEITRQIDEDLHKEQLQIADKQYRYDTFANTTFGYGGASSGFPKWFLDAGAGVINFKENWNSDVYRPWWLIEGWGDDPLDRAASEAGMNLWEQYGSNGLPLDTTAIGSVFSVVDDAVERERRMEINWQGAQAFEELVPMGSASNPFAQASWLNIDTIGIAQWMSEIFNKQSDDVQEQSMSVSSIHPLRLSLSNVQAKNSRDHDSSRWQAYGESFRETTGGGPNNLLAGIEEARQAWLWNQRSMERAVITFGDSTEVAREELATVPDAVQAMNEAFSRAEALFLGRQSGGGRRGGGGGGGQSDGSGGGDSSDSGSGGSGGDGGGNSGGSGNGTSGVTTSPNLGSRSGFYQYDDPQPIKQDPSPGKPTPLRHGGRAPGGLSLVGEAGPELLALPTGARVTSAPMTRALLRDIGDGDAPSGGTVNNNTLHINVTGVSDVQSFVRELRRELRAQGLDFSEVQ